MAADRQQQSQGAGVRRAGDAVRRLPLRGGARRRRPSASECRMRGAAGRARRAPAPACSGFRTAARLPAASSALRNSRPRFSSASDWLVVAASTPAAATLTGRVTTSTAVAGDGADDAAAEQRWGSRSEDQDAHCADPSGMRLKSTGLVDPHRLGGERFGLDQQRFVGRARRQRLRGR